jgi:hypothetical protein
MFYRRKLRDVAFGYALVEGFREANLILGRTGEAFWQDESFDHRVRDEVERRIRGTGHGRARGWQAKAPAPQLT